MPSYATPGVHIEEIAVFPPSVAPVATAVPAFIGYTEKAIGAAGQSLTKTAVRITSLLEYEQLFGSAFVESMKINIDKRVAADGSLIGVNVGWEGTPPAVPSFALNYEMRLYFANGGGPCYIYSLGPYSTTAGPPVTATIVDTDFTAAILALESEDEPTILAFPDAALIANDAQVGGVIDGALSSCEKMKDRFTLADVPAAMTGKTATNNDVTTNFRGKIAANEVKLLKYGAAYFPYVSTLLLLETTAAKVTVNNFKVTRVLNDGTSFTTKYDKTKPAGPDAAPTPAVTDFKVNKALNDTTTFDMVKTETAVNAAVRAFLDRATATLPPSGAVAGVYAQTDRTRGVWKAPANVGLALVTGTAVAVTNDLQSGLNIDATSGKSVNAIRSFFGKGTLVWGARTLAGNDGEWKYVPVRRFANFVEESIGKAIASFVFEPNDANTWVKVRTMIENFLTLQWRDGALMGAKPEHAFNVAVGLGKTMTPQDVIDGLMIVEVQLAIVRPAEFIVLKFMQKMPTA